MYKMYVYIYTYEVYTKGRVNRRRGSEYIKEEGEKGTCKTGCAHRIIRSDNSINRFSLSDSPTSVHPVVIFVNVKGRVA